VLVTIRISDENGKLNLNKLEDPLVYEWFTRLMGSADQIDLIADYVDADTEPRPAGLEDADMPVLYRAKNAAIASLAELGAVPGMRADTLSQLANVASVYLPSEALVNINTAPREVLAAMNVPSLIVEGIIAFRDQNHYFTALSPEVTGDAPVPFDTAIPEFAALVDRLAVASQTFTVTAEALILNPEVRARVQAVVRRSGCGEGMPEPCIVSWSES
jgi:type II secretory pathway component PulK